MQPNRVWLNQGGAGRHGRQLSADSGQTLGNHSSVACRWATWTATATWTPSSPTNRREPGVAEPGGRQGGTAGSFTDSGQTLGNHYSFSVSLGDVDGDGDLDAFVANHDANRVWLNAILVDLAITKTSNQVAVTQGDTLSYTIVVSGDAANVARTSRSATRSPVCCRM